MSGRDKWVKRCLNRLHIGQFLERAAEWLATFLITFGCLVLIVKLLLPDLWPHVLWVSILAIPCTVAAWWVSKLRHFTWNETVAYLDKRINAGGLLMSLYETSDEHWDERLPQYETRWAASLPRFRPKRFASMTAVPCLFAIAVCFVPLREAVPDTVLKNTVGQQASSKLEKLLEELEKEDVLEEEEKEELEQEIEKLKQETLKTPLTHEKWETVDALQQKMLQRLDQKSRALQKASAATDELAKAGSNNLTEQEIQALEQQLSKTLAKLGMNADFKNGMKLGKGKSGEGKQGELRLPKDAAARKKALEDLKKHLDKQCEKCEGLKSECNGEGCKDGQCKGGNCQNGNCKNGNCQKPGQGGINRGRADADMSWGEENDPAGTKFKAMVLPPGFLEQPKDEIMGIKRSAPNVDPASSAPRSKAHQLDPSSGRETWNRTLRPKHRKVVRGFFDSKSE